MATLETKTREEEDDDDSDDDDSDDGGIATAGIHDGRPERFKGTLALPTESERPALHHNCRERKDECI